MGLFCSVANIGAWGSLYNKIRRQAGAELRPAETDVLEDVQYHNIPDEDKWRINMLGEHVNVKENDCTIPGLKENEIDEILEYICTG